MQITLKELQNDMKEKFVKMNQYAFKYGAIKEFDDKYEYYEEDGEIISKSTIEKSIDEGTAYCIYADDEMVGGVVVCIRDKIGDLDLLFIDPKSHSKGIGYKAWCLIEKMYPNVEKWITYTPCFETRNIHFYVNRCGFHIVAYLSKYHRPKDNECYEELDDDEMFKFEKVMK